MSNERDRVLGMNRSITRRDFLNGCALTVGASLSTGSPAWLELMAAADIAPEKEPSYYPPAKTGMRGSHDGSWEVAHGMRDGQTWPDAAQDQESYDLIVVGGGISGLAAAYFFRKLATVDPRFHTPSAAIVVQALLSIILLLAAGSAGDSFKKFFSVAIFSEWIFYMIASSSIFVFRHREADARRPYKMWGYPILPALFVAAAAVLLCFTLADDLRDREAGHLVLLACAVILAGIPIFYAFARRRSNLSS